MRRRLVAAIAGVAAAAVLLLAVPLGIVLGRNYRDEELVRLQRDTVAATREIDVSRAGDRVELPRSPDALTVYDRLGRRVAGRGPAAAPALVRDSLRSGRVADASGDERLVVAVPLLTAEHVTGAVRAERSEAAVSREARGAWLVLGGVALAIIAAAVLAALLLGRRLAAPLERLAGAAARLGEGDFSVRAERAGVAELDEVAAALDATAARLDELVTRERAFSADASHQLRTPLQALRIELEAMQLRGDTAPEVEKAVAQVDRLTATIDTLLSVARDTREPAADLDLAQLLDAVESNWRGPLAAAGRPLRIRHETRAAHARASSPAVTEVLEVLLANAERHGEGAVTVTLHEVEGWLAVDVADEGLGFSDPEGAFERRGPGADDHGIGLALARSLAHAEGGRLTLADSGRRPTVRLLLAAAR